MHLHGLLNEAALAMTRESNGFPPLATSTLKIRLDLGFARGMTENEVYGYLWVRGVAIYEPTRAMNALTVVMTLRCSQLSTSGTSGQHNFEKEPVRGKFLSSDVETDNGPTHGARFSNAITFEYIPLLRR
jgi:hypothetical protein